MSDKKVYTRRAHHSGSWYPSGYKELDETLSTFLTKAENEMNSSKSEADEGIPRGVISPHAGYRYSGETAAFSYLALREVLLQMFGEKRDCEMTVVVLHPSHHVCLDGCAISGATTIETPLTHLHIDDDLRAELMQTGEFSLLDRNTDEREHSGEMQYPFIAKVMLDALKITESNCIKCNEPNTFRKHLRVLPIMVGSTSNILEKKIGSILSLFLARPNIFTVVSSDFCHWGVRFGYSPQGKCTNEGGGLKVKNEIFEYIKWLDHLGMDQITMQQPGAFASYLSKYKNTICGRHPIGIWLNSIKTNYDIRGEKLGLKFVKYSQSSLVRSVRESSVSYASAVARIDTS